MALVLGVAMIALLALAAWLWSVTRDRQRARCAIIGAGMAAAMVVLIGGGGLGALSRMPGEAPPRRLRPLPKGGDAFSPAKLVPDEACGPQNRPVLRGCHRRLVHHLSGE